VASNRLQREIGKRQPFGTIQEEAMLNLLRTTDQVQIHFTRLFRKFSLTSSQYNVLRILRGEGKPLPILEIAQRTVTVVPGITGLIDRLEEASMVRRQRCPDDRRVIYVAISEPGIKILARLDGPVQELHQKLFAHLTPVELTALIHLLERVRETAISG
jgi:DNA-binding MarR family transcriptional regulator